MKRPFPSKVRWLMYWKHRYIILDFLNQVAHGTNRDACRIAEQYGGVAAFGLALKKAADAVIVKK